MARTRSTSSKPSSSSAVRTSSTAGLPYASPLSRPSGHDSPVARRLATKIAQGKLSNAEKMELKRERNRNKQRAYRDRIENQISALDRQNHQLESVSSNQAALILSLKDKILDLEGQLVQQQTKKKKGVEKGEGRSSPKASPANDGSDEDESRTIEGSPPPAAASPQEAQPPRLIFRPNDGSPPIDLYAQKEEDDEEEEEPFEVEIDAGSNGEVDGSSRGGLERIEEVPDEEMELPRDGDGDGEDGAGSGMDREEEDEVEDAFNDVEDEEMESSISPLSFEPNNQPSSHQPFEFVNPHQLHRPSSANSDTFLLDDDSPSQYGSPTSSSSSSSSSGFAINPSDLLSSPALGSNHYHYDSIQAPIYQTSNGYHLPSGVGSSPLQPRAHHHHQNDASSSSSDPSSPKHCHHQSFTRTQDIHYDVGVGVPPLPHLPPFIPPQSSSSSVQQPTSSSRTDAPAPLSRLRPKLAVVVPPSTVSSSFGVVTKPSVSNIRGGRGGGRWAPLEMDEGGGERSRNVKVEEDEKRPEWRESGKGMLTRKRTSLGYQYC